VKTTNQATQVKKYMKAKQIHTQSNLNKGQETAQAKTNSKSQKAQGDQTTLTLQNAGRSSRSSSNQLFVRHKR